MARNLLLVDDEENILRSLVRLLRRDGYQIHTANSGREGLEVLKDNDIGVILSDQRMPEMSGVDFLGEVKVLYPDTVRMVLSGYTDLKSVTDAINQGAIYKFLTKPWEDDLLSANIREAFEHYEMASENMRLTRELQAANAELARINQSLETNVKEKTRTLDINLRALHIAQDVLEKLPIAVLGISDDGMIAVANLMANTLLSQEGGLVGRYTTGLLPQELVELCQQTLATPAPPAARPISLGATSYEARCSRLSQESGGQGVILVLLEKGTLDS